MRYGRSGRVRRKKEFVVSVLPHQGFPLTSRLPPGAAPSAVRRPDGERRRSWEWWLAGQRGQAARRLLRFQAALVDIDMAGGFFTWPNLRTMASCSWLDKFLVSVDWEDHFPCSQLAVLTRVASDHRPIIVKTSRVWGRRNSFRMELFWLCALGTWVFSVAGALVAIPVGIRRKSLAPLVFFGTTGTMLDIIMGISQCEREHAERQMKLLETQSIAAVDSLDKEVE
ncbi:hypothetical protein Taro_024624 [Colocasia esculenta]|uniref:Uncharacterized protein n=1 Tax=Colocasia esculenta TaxID=4460 RepID=A0A843V790_COLES|nr:hypothetical protein [Colocasia esculenta]